MVSAIISFLGGSAFRAVWGEVASFVSKKQEHQQELDLMKLQAQNDAQKHAQDLERLKVSSELGIKEVQVKADYEVELAEINSFTKGLEVLNQKSGVAFIDGWNGSIRPAYATFALLLWVLSIYQRDFSLNLWDLDLMAGIAGFYFANRELAKRNK